VTDRLWIGIRKHGAGWRATVTAGRTTRLQKHFPKATDPRVMQRWRADTKAELHVSRKQRATMGMFVFDARRYLTLVKALPTYAERVRHIAFWIEEFGERDRSSIGPSDIRGVRDRLLTEARSPGRPPLSPHTVNLHLRALSNLYKVLDGSRGYNPVRDVPEAPEPDQAPRALAPEAIAAIVRHLPDYGPSPKGQKAVRYSKSKIRIRCLATCPITPRQLMQLQPEDLNLHEGQIRLPARAKGKGARAVWQPLLPGAAAAFADFTTHNLFGAFSLRTVRRAFYSAAKRAGYSKARLYDLRHSVATRLYTATGSLDVVGRYLQHADPRTTATYAAGGHRSVMQDAADRLAQQFGATERRLLRIDVDFCGPSTDTLVPVQQRRKGESGANKREK